MFSFCPFFFSTLIFNISLELRYLWMLSSLFCFDYSSDSTECFFTYHMNCNKDNYFLKSKAQDIRQTKRTLTNMDWLHIKHCYVSMKCCGTGALKPSLPHKGPYPCTLQKVLRPGRCQPTTSQSSSWNIEINRTILTCLD